jgi:subfamily B ATP-binding cassette protein MsbA
MAPLKAITQFPGQMAQALAGADRVFEVLGLPAPEGSSDVGSVAHFEREVRFEHVWFRYVGGPSAHTPPRRKAAAELRLADEDAETRWVLRDVSFTLPKGRTVALVGPSGAGKTTLAELLPRLREPTLGSILLDGVPITECSRRSLRALIGFVGQETIVFNDTVLANIAYGRPGASEAEVEASARAANAHDFIARMHEGYHTRLGERGTRLSGGQRQRIAIARAILRDPAILILDEATSALDRESERLVHEALIRLMRDRTVLVIAHRLATVRHADLILVVEDGRIVERGSHDELMRGNGLYRRLASHAEGQGERSRAFA